MPKYIFLDTNNWIYLSNGFNILSEKYDELHLKIFDLIKKRNDDGSLIFLVNDIVIEEWKRNILATQNQIKDIENKFKSYQSTFKAIKAFINEDLKEYSIIDSKLAESCFEKTKRHKNHVNEVEHFLLNSTVKIDIRDNVKIEATNLALAKKAPFIGEKKNSMADALILLSSIDYLSANQVIKIPKQTTDSDDEIIIYPESYFVSSNAGDFSSTENKEIIHPDLETILNRTNTKFYHTLGRLINSLEKEFLTYEEEFEIEHVDDSVYCEICNCEYFPTVRFSEEFLIPDENKGSNLVNQLKFQFDSTNNNEYKPEDIMTSVRKANCVYCGSEFIECDCGELNLIESFNTPFPCNGECGTVFVVNANVDKKGTINGEFQYKIIKEIICKGCEEIVEALNDEGLCSDCENGL